MSNSFEFILPVVGATGVYELLAPYDKLILPQEQYTCQSVRRISEYLANNETPYEDHYAAHGVSQDIYEEDNKANRYIVGLQAGVGQWIYVPARFIAVYPVTNGVAYRALTYTVALPAMRADADMQYFKQGLQDYVRSTLGVESIIEEVETSKTVLVDRQRADAEELKRDMVRSSPGTDYSRLAQLTQDYNAAQLKIRELEAYLLDNLQA